MHFNPGGTGSLPFTGYHTFPNAHFNVSAPDPSTFFISQTGRHRKSPARSRQKASTTIESLDWSGIDIDI